MKRAAIVAALMLSACEQKAPVPTAKAAPPPEPVATLSTTWLVPGQPPQTTQTAFSSMSKCDAARDAALAAGRQARSEIQRQNEADRDEVKRQLAQDQADIQARFGAGIVSPGPAQMEKMKGQPLPTVSAVCLAQ